MALDFTFSAPHPCPESSDGPDFFHISTISSFPFTQEKQIRFSFLWPSSLLILLHLGCFGE